MAKFTTRVELIDADSSDYDTLHEEMENRNFTRIVTTTQGVNYYLPPAEYNREGDYTADQTLNAAKNAAAATDREYRVIVTQATIRRWYNLEPVN